MQNEKLWYKNAVFYQIHVKCFRDSNGDGIGDFRGLTEKLAHIQNLGCNAIWLQPFYPSPLRDDGYDIADYCTIHPDYGTMEDFKHFLSEAKKRGLKVVTELVLNHTSDQHQWFRKARTSPKGSKYRDYYIWSDAADKYLDCRIIFKDFETSNWTFDHVANSYFFHRFYSHQPDLNYDNPDVHEEIFKIVDLWMGMGVDGLRLDAVPYLYKREGTDCENLPETHVFLQKLRQYIDGKYENRMLLAEANQWPEQACLYFGDGNECHMAFHFPVMPRLFMAIHKEDRFPIIDILDQTPKPPKDCQWAMFLRNHDELTLEMVTDEERDYMWRVYAKDPRARINLGIRRRLAPLMNNDRQKIELMFILLFSLPGSPVIYYGDEIGMGDNYYLGDRNGVRTPMQWNNDRNAGFSDGDPQKLYLPLIIDPQYHHEYLNVENQEHSPSSLLSWIKTVVNVREHHPAFGSGEIRFLSVKNSKILAFVRESGNDAILIIANLSSFPQYAEIDLKDWSGYTPVDLFSQNSFAEVTSQKYGITLGKHGYYWLLLKPVKQKVAGTSEDFERKFSVKTSWDEVLCNENRTYIQKETLPLFLTKQRWFRSKEKPIKNVTIQDEVMLGDSKILNIRVCFIDDYQESYQIPLTFVSEEELSSLKKEAPHSIIAELEVNGKKGALADAVYASGFRKSLLEGLIGKSSYTSTGGTLSLECSGALNKALDKKEGKSCVMTMEQSNTSINYDDMVILKLYRRIEDGTNPDFELIKHLTEKSGYGHIPKYLGGIEWHTRGNKSQIGLAQTFISKGESAWAYTLKELEASFPQLMKDNTAVETLFQNYIRFVKLLGKRTAELHLAFSKETDGPEMDPEAFTMLYQKSLYQAMRAQIKTNLQLLRDKKNGLDAETQKIADQVISKENDILDIIKRLEKRRFSAHKIRIHGDYHLGQIIYTGDDVILIDFEGEPILPIGERRLKKPVLQDVAALIRSFDYAITTFLVYRKEEQNEEAMQAKEIFMRVITDAFVKSYVSVIKKASVDLIPKDQEDFDILKNAYLLNKAVYEIGYELKNRPSWIKIPLLGLRSLLKELK